MEGLGFFNYFMEKDFGRPICTTDLDDLATWCKWMPTDDQKTQKYREELAKRGISNYATLIKSGHKFYGLDFGIFGKGGKFLSLALGDVDTSDKRVEHLVTLAKKMGWSADADKVLKALASKGITDYWTMFSLEADALNRLEFEGIGGARKLAGIILKRTVTYIDQATRDEIIARLGWLPSEEEKKKRYMEMLSQYGIYDYWTVRYKYSQEQFQALEFKGVGKGTNFVIAVLGKSEGFSVEIREEFAKHFGWIPTN